MLFNILMVILVLYAISSPFWVIRCVKFGMKAAGKPEKAAAEPIFTLQKKKQEVKLSAEEQKTLDVLENIEIYDGTPNGQKEIE